MSVAKQGALPDQSSGFLQFVRDGLATLAFCLILLTFLFQPFHIPSSSMLPTLLVGDALVVSKYSYGYSGFSIPFTPQLFSGRIWGASPARGDVAVFRTPQEGATFIKRVVGLPGDTVQMVNGRLVINGQVAERQPAANFQGRNEFGEMAALPRYTETLPGGVSHSILEVQGDEGMLDSTPVFRVPQGHYFMMGDNRDNSLDSRVEVRGGGAGLIPFDHFIGRAEYIVFSVRDGESGWHFWRWPWSVRWDRLGTKIR